MNTDHNEIESQWEQAIQSMDPQKIQNMMAQDGALGVSENIEGDKTKKSKRSVQPMDKLIERALHLVAHNQLDVPKFEACFDLLVSVTCFDQKRNGFQTLLHQAIAGVWPEIIGVKIIPHVNLTTTEEPFRTPLAMAIASDNEVMVKRILEFVHFETLGDEQKKECLNNLMQDKKNPVLWLAAKRNALKTFTLMLPFSDPNEIAANVLSNYEKSPLLHALISNRKNKSAALSKRRSMVELLIADPRCDIHLKWNGLSVLDLAKKKGEHEWVQLITSVIEKRILSQIIPSLEDPKGKESRPVQGCSPRLKSL